MLDVSYNTKGSGKFSIEISRNFIRRISLIKNKVLCCFSHYLLNVLHMISLFILVSDGSIAIGAICLLYAANV